MRRQTKPPLMVAPYPPRRPVSYAPPDVPYLSVLYDDDDLLIVSKQSGLLSVPGRGPSLADCVASRAQTRFPSAMIVHRLDLDTSGIMVIARNPDAHRHLSLQFERRQVAKIYVARVWGLTVVDAGEIDSPLVCDWPNRPRQIIDHINGRSAVTTWQMIEREDKMTRVLLKPQTGRSHQLRVHMMSVGHPILGDNLYAHDQAYTAADRLQLHALSLSFRHPASGSRMTFEDPCPF